MSNIQKISPEAQMLNPKEAVVRCFKKYATFRGRATRAEYWWFILFNSLVCMAVYAAVRQLMGTETADDAMGMVQLVLFLPALAVSVRRLHDINFNGWWLLLWLTVIGFIPLVIFFCLPGKAEENRFGSRDADTQTEKQEGRGTMRTMGIFFGILAGTCFAVPLFAAQTVTDGEVPFAASAERTESSETVSSYDTSSDTSLSVSTQEMEQGLQQAFGELFFVMEEVIGGMTKGMQEGARVMQIRLDGADGTRLITDGKALAELTETGVLKAEQTDDLSWKIVVSVKNTQEFPVRLTGLTDKGQVFLLDQEDFVHEPKTVGERLVTVPERAAQKIIFVFPELDGSAPKTVRLYGVDFAVPNPVNVRHVIQ